jgi:hypothetical protein
MTEQPDIEQLKHTAEQTQPLAANLPWGFAAPRVHIHYREEHCFLLEHKHSYMCYLFLIAEHEVPISVLVHAFVCRSDQSIIPIDLTRT